MAMWTVTLQVSWPDDHTKLMWDSVKRAYVPSSFKRKYQHIEMPTEGGALRKAKSIAQSFWPGCQTRKLRVKKEK